MPETQSLDSPAPIPAARVPASPKVREWARARGVSEWMAARIAKVSPRPKATLDGLLRRPPRYIRVNPLRADVNEARKRLEARGFEFAKTDLDPNVLQVMHAPLSPGATLEHLLGMTTPQDLASASAGLALGTQRGEVVVDLAAAPGVKSLHIAGDLEDRGALVCVDPEPARVRALRFNLERAGATCPVILQRRGEELPGLAGGEPFADRVLLDAPCTGEGTMPKDPKRRRGRIEEVAQVTPTQQSLLAAADAVLKPGGTLVYATCTLGPEENEGMVQRMLNHGYHLEPLPFDRCGDVPLAHGVTEWPGLELDPVMDRCRRFFPGIHPTLGFFVAKLRKPSGGDP